MTLTCPDCHKPLEKMGVPDEIVSGYIGYNCKCVGHWTLEKRTKKWYRWKYLDYYVGHYEDAKQIPLEVFKFR